MSLIEGVEGADDPGKEVSVLSREDQLLQTVLASGNVEVLERFIALRNAEQDRQARLAFEDAFAKMRSELPIIKKNKEVKLKSGKHMYNYAPLEDIQKTCDPILQKHGFSYSWREEAIDSGKRVWFELFGFGHTKSNCFDAPLLGPKSNDSGEYVNAVQAARMTSSYAKRNSMVDGLGLIIEDEDQDANLDLADEELKKTLATMDNAKTEIELLDASKKAKDKYANKPEAITFIVGKFAECKAKLRAPQ